MNSSSKQPKKVYTQKQVLSFLKTLQKKCREAAKDCEEAQKEQAKVEKWASCIDLEGKKYAYYFAEVDIIEELVKDIEKGIK